VTFTEPISRRRFLYRAGAGLAGAVAAPSIIPGKAFAAGTGDLPSEKITLGVIGVGKQGYYLLRGFLHQPGTQVLAVCDVDENKLARAKAFVEKTYGGAQSGGSYKGCDAYRDYRSLLQRGDIDAVVIATPDHWHALQSIQAMRLGKDVYCEKPLSLTIGEAKQMVLEARKWSRVFQTGSMQRSDNRFRFACELVRNGYIGDVRTVRVSVRTGFLNHPQPCELAAEKVPAELDWDLWLGPAPFRPYNAILAPPISFDGFPAWRDYIDYSGGGMTDWGAHHFDIAQWGLGMDDSGPVEIIPPDGKEFKYLTYRYATGTLLTGDFEDNLIQFTGTKGTVTVNREYLKTYPENLVNVRISPQEIHLYRSANHYSDWLDAIRHRTIPITDAQVGCRSVTVCHLGNIAVQLNKRVQWDPVLQQFSDAEAQRLVTRAMRSPWEI
jgi:predicted dehydrogenase